MGNKIELSQFVDAVFQTPQNETFWFGYYNYSPINKKGDKILSHKASFDGRPVNENDEIEVGWFDLNSHEWHRVDKTCAFNWQQGSMLQWIGETDSFIYNVKIGDHFGCRIYNIENGRFEEFDSAIYGISSIQNSSITIKFERSYWCRAYHYECIADPKWDGLIADGDALYNFDFSSKELKPIVTINDLITCGYKHTFDSAKHWIEHIMLTPNQKRVAFYHRFTHGSGFETRIFTCNLDGTDLKMLPQWKDYSWSHMGWRDDSEFVVFGVKKNSSVQAYRKITEQTGRLGKLIRWMYKKTLSKLITKKVRKATYVPGVYQLYNCNTTELLEVFDVANYSLDGHPTFTKDGKYMLTDTYEDEKSYRHLLLYNTERKNTIELASFYSPFNSCSYRSDLHPRFDMDEKNVIVDTAHNGHHSVLVLKVDWDNIKKEIG